VRNSLKFVPWKVRKEVASDLKRVYAAATVEEVELMLAEFEVKWDQNYPSIYEEKSPINITAHAH